MTRFYLDSADLAEARPLLGTGLLAGLTTNPTLLQRAGVPNRELPALVAGAREAGARTVFVQTWGDGVQELTERGRWIRSLGDDVVVKVPVSAAGLQATARLSGEGVPVLATAVYAAAQVLPVIAAGARYVAPYLGRMDDNGRAGRAEVATMQRIVTAAGSDLRVLVASLRSVADVVALAELGVADFTLSATLWAALAADPLTDAAVEGFDAASAAGGPAGLGAGPRSDPGLSARG